MSDNQQQHVESATCDVVTDHGNVDAVRRWLHSDRWYSGRKQVMVLFGAARKGHTDICQLVLDCATVSTDDLITALHTACYYGLCYLSVVQLIVSTLGHHCNTQLLNDSLRTAVSRCHAEVMNWLLPLTHPTMLTT
jgi:hypothetical protein